MLYAFYWILRRVIIYRNFVWTIARDRNLLSVHRHRANRTRSIEPKANVITDYFLCSKMCQWGKIDYAGQGEPEDTDESITELVGELSFAMLFYHLNRSGRNDGTTTFPARLIRISNFRYPRLRVNKRHLLLSVT